MRSTLMVWEAYVGSSCAMLPTGPVTLYQESTYQPDTTWRWTGSIAMDHAGNLALGFSASSSSLFPSIRYAGRLASDPLNTLSQGEATLIAGGGSQTDQWVGRLQFDVRGSSGRLHLLVHQRIPPDHGSR